MPPFYLVIISTCVPRSTGPSYFGGPAGISLSSSMGIVSGRCGFFALFDILSALSPGIPGRLISGPPFPGPREHGPQVRTSRNSSAMARAAATADITLLRPPAFPPVRLRGTAFSAPRNRFGCPSLFRMVRRQCGHMINRRAGASCSFRRNMFHGRRPEVKTKKRRDPRPVFKYGKSAPCGAPITLRTWRR
jgi:hypothetical protein